MTKKESFQQYIDNITQFTQEKDEKVVQNIIKADGDNIITFEEARLSLEDVFSNVVNLINDMMELQENRDETIIRNLPPMTRRLIMEELQLNEDIMFEDKNNTDEEKDDN